MLLLFIVGWSIMRFLNKRDEKENRILYLQNWTKKFGDGADKVIDAAM